jgi:hypothetical protein
MGIFGNKKEKEIDMSEEKRRKDFIDKAIKDKGMAAPIRTEINRELRHIPMPPIPPEGLRAPPPITPLPPEFDSRQQNDETVDLVFESNKDLEEQKKADNLNSKMKITIELETDSRELLMQMVDGVAEITQNFGADTIQTFKVEKCNQ